MGVAIHGYGKITHVPTADPANWDELDGYGYSEDRSFTKAYALDGFPHALEGLEGADDVVEHSWGRLLGGQNYLLEDPYEDYASLAYSGYGFLRRRICEATLGVQPDVVWEFPELFVGQPYYDLINFADNEGVLGPVACQRLADPWDNYPVTFEDRFYQEQYDILGRNFHHAAGRGMVVYS